GVGPCALNLFNPAQVLLERPVGNQLHVINGQHFLPAEMPSAITVRYIQHRRANRLPHRASPARFKRTVHLRARVRRRRRRQPERIRRTNPGKIDAQISHGPPAFHQSPAPPSSHPARPLPSKPSQSRGCNRRRHTLPANSSAIAGPRKCSLSPSSNSAAPPAK